MQRYRDSFMNHVIRLRMKWNPGLGFILKLAPPRMQCPGLALEAPVERGENEFRALKHFHKTVMNCVPLPVFYDNTMHTLCTQELIGFQALSQRVLTSGCSYSGARAFGATLAAVHAATHVLNVGKGGLQDLLLQFPTLDAMVTLIRVFHYERPFDPDDLGKRCAPEVKSVLRELYNDSSVMATIGNVRRIFIEDKECLIHGDLHVDSVIVKDNDFKMVDAEFARVGPCAYDMGLLLATLLLVYYHQCHVLHVPNHETETNVTEKRHIKRHSQEISSCDEVAGDAEKSVSQQILCGSEAENGSGVEDVLLSQSTVGYKRSGFRPSKAQDVLSMCSVMAEEYVDHLQEKLHLDQYFGEKLVHDIAAFTACELLSCIIGPSHFDFLDNSSQAQVNGVTSALRLLRQLDNVKTVKDIVGLVSL